MLKRIHVKLRPFCPLSDQDPPCRPTHPPLPEVGWVLLGPVLDIDSGGGGGGLLRPPARRSKTSKCMWESVKTIDSARFLLFLGKWLMTSIVTLLHSSLGLWSTGDDHILTLIK